MKGRLGFTLIELVVALGIFMVLGLLSYRALSSIIESRDRVEVEQRRWLSITRFMQRLEIDIQQVPLSLTNAIFYEAGQQTLHIIRLNPSPAGDDARSIRYQWRDGRIEREERRFVTMPVATNSAPLIDADVVLDGVKKLEWSWPEIKPDASGEFSWTLPASVPGNRPPVGLRIELELTDVSGNLQKVLALR